MKKNCYQQQHLVAPTVAVSAPMAPLSALVTPVSAFQSTSSMYADSTVTSSAPPVPFAGSSASLVFLVPAAVCPTLKSPESSIPELQQHTRKSKTMFLISPCLRGLKTMPLMSLSLGGSRKMPLISLSAGGLNMTPFTCWSLKWSETTLSIISLFSRRSKWCLFTLVCLDIFQAVHLISLSCLDLSQEINLNFFF